MKERFLSLTLQRKIAILFGAISMILVLLLSITFLWLMSDSTFDRYKTGNAMMTEQIGNTVEHFLSTAENLSTLFVMQRSTQTFVKMQSETFSELSSDEFLRYYDMKEFVDCFSGQSSGTYFNYIVLFSKNGMCYTAGYAEKAHINRYDDIKRSELYQLVIQNKGKPVWSIVRQGSPLIEGLKSDKVALMRTVIETDRYTDSGTLIMFVDIETIRNLYASRFSDDTMNIVLVDENGRLVCENENSPVPYCALEEAGAFTPSADIHLNLSLLGNRYLLTRSEIGHTGWRVVIVKDMAEISKQFQSILLLMLLVMLICVVLIVSVSHYAASFITKPLRKLMEAMHDYEGGRLEGRVSFKYHDEIGELGQRYNEMAARIQNLIVNTYQLELEEKQAQLRVMQSQINPHFLYNTLDSLFWRAQKSENRELAGDIYALSQFFRLNLNEGKMVTTVDNEKRLIEAYLTLQTRRYRKKIAYEISCDERILAYRIPKLILQPFVENAVLHGVLKGDRDGFVRVVGYEVDGMLTFEIADNGVGIPPSTLDELLQSVRRPDELGERRKHSFGIQNVYDRLRIVYANEFTFQIESESGVGTKVTLSFPANGLTEGAVSHG